MSWPTDSTWKARPLVKQGLFFCGLIAEQIPTKLSSFAEKCKILLDFTAFRKAHGL